MTSSIAILIAADTNHLPPPCSIFTQDNSTPVLPRPMSSIPNVVDSGRIKFGASMRLPLSR
jgi:hypothetical protein